MLEFEGVHLVVPPGALGSPTSITIRRAKGPLPSGYSAFSPLYEFEPANLTFSKPISLGFKFTGDPAVASVFWSRASGGGYDRLGGTIEGDTVTATSSHFSSGFVADGVEYADPPDLSCTVARLLEGRTLSNSSIALFFTVDDCTGRPVTDLTPLDFILTEDGSPISVEADAFVLPQRGLQVFLTLSLDVSGSASAYLTQIINGAKAVVQKLQVEKGLPVQIAIDVFAGSVIEWQPHTLETAKLLSRLDALLSYRPADLNSTNLRGAVIGGLNRLATSEAAFRGRNYGGAFTTGYLMLFTDGRDTTGQYTEVAATSAVHNTADQVLAVGLVSLDYDPAALSRLATFGVISSPGSSALQRDFAATAARIAGQVKRSYALAYCSPKRFGTHTVGVGTFGGTLAAYDFFAGGFTSGCTANELAEACEGLGCGGLGCGACDDRVAACDQELLQCVDFCDSLEKCGGEVIDNPLGYQQRCDDTPDRELLKTSPQHCGSCGHQCPVACDDGTCVSAVDVQLGGQHACALLSNGKVRCWGDNQFGQMGIGRARSTSCQFGPCYPRPVPVLDGVSQIAVGANHTCAIRDGAVLCWGDDQWAQTGTPDSGEVCTLSNLPCRKRPALVPDVTNARNLALGYRHSCAVLEDGTARCWGANESGQVGVAGGGTIHVPAPVPLSAVTSISAGASSTCVLLEDATVQCWGSNGNGELGDGSTMSRYTPAAVTDLTGVAEIALSGNFACAALDVAGGGTVKCWGSNLGTLGDGTAIDRILPVDALGVSGARSLALGGNNSCALGAGDSIWCWGAGNVFALTGSPQFCRFTNYFCFPTPTPVAGLTGASRLRLSNGFYPFGCVRFNDGTLRCLGDNTFGELGAGDAGYSPGLRSVKW